MPPTMTPRTPILRISRLHARHPFQTLAPLATTALLTTPIPTLPQDTATADTTPDPHQEGLPLAPGHTISTSFTEGSWMSVDVRPDDTRVVFTSDRSGGEAIHIASPDYANEDVLGGEKPARFTPFVRAAFPAGTGRQANGLGPRFRS